MTGPGSAGTRRARARRPFATGITATKLHTLVRRQVQLDGTVDSSPIYLHAVTVAGATHDTFFVTTTYGKTEAIDADTGSVLWRYTPPGYSSWASSAQITTATPVADSSRRWIYAASPGGKISKLSVATGSVAWTVSITRLPVREKIAASLNFDRGHVIATTGGYIGDQPPYQGHVAVIQASNGALLHVWNSLCSNQSGLLFPASCPASDSAIWGRAGAVVDPKTHDLLVATGNAPWDGKTNWGDAVLRLSPDATRLLGNYTPANTAELNSSDQDLGSTSPVILSSTVIAQGGKDGKIRLLSVARMRGARLTKAARSKSYRRRRAPTSSPPPRCGARRRERGCSLRTTAAPRRGGFAATASPWRGATAGAGRVPSSPAGCFGSTTRAAG